MKLCYFRHPLCILVRLNWASSNKRGRGVNVVNVVYRVNWASSNKRGRGVNVVNVLYRVTLLVRRSVLM